MRTLLFLLTLFLAVPVAPTDLKLNAAITEDLPPCSLGNGYDADHDGTIDSGCPGADHFSSVTGGYAVDVGNCALAPPFTSSADATANAGTKVSKPVGSNYAKGQIWCRGTVADGTYYLWGLVKYPSTSEAQVWASTILYRTGFDNSTRTVFTAPQPQFGWQLIRSNLPLKGATGLYLMADTSVEFDCLYLTTSTTATPICPTGTPPPSVNYTVLDLGASSITIDGTVDAIWTNANTITVWGLKNSTDVASFKALWKSSTNKLYFLFSLNDSTVVGNTSANDDSAILGDDYIDVQWRNGVVRSLDTNVRAITVNARATPVWWDGSYNSSGVFVSATNLNPSCAKAGSYLIECSVDLGWSATPDQLILLEVDFGDNDNPGFSYGIAFSSNPGGINTITDPAWTVARLSSSVVPAPPADTTAPTFTSCTTTNIGAASADAQCLITETVSQPVTALLDWDTNSGTPYANVTSTVQCMDKQTCTIHLSGLPTGVPIYWRMRGNDTSGNGGQSVELNFTTIATTVLYASPGASGSSPCPIGTPCRLSTAIGLAQPGYTIILRNGTYTPSNSGRVNINCASGGNARNGTALSPITIVSENPRLGFIQGDGADAVVRITGCAYWIFDNLRIENVDVFASPLSSTDGYVWTTSYLGSPNHDITVKRSILRRPNSHSNQNAVVKFIDGGTNYLFEDNEVLDFVGHGLACQSGSQCVVRRNYINPRDEVTITKYSDNLTSFQPLICYGCGNGISIFENNIIDIDLSLTPTNGYSQPTGFSDYPSGGGASWTLGNIIITARTASLDPSHHATSAMWPNGSWIKNNVVLRGPIAGQNGNSTTVGDGYRSYLPQNVLVENNSVLGGDSSTAYALWDYDAQFPSVGAASITLRNNLGTGTGSGYGIYFSNDGNWGSYTIDYINLYNFGSVSFGSPTMTHSTQTNPNLGGCTVFIPDKTPMQGAGFGGADIGANVLYAYEKGVLQDGNQVGGKRTKLWNSALAGADRGKWIATGTIVTGVNDGTINTLATVHKKLGFGTGSCNFPAGY